MKIYTGLFLAIACTLFLASGMASSLAVVQGKVNICHKTGHDNWVLISISENALPAHLAHGDILLTDADMDGWVEAENACVPGGDCDDTNPAVNPGTAEVRCNGLDDDCDGIVDDLDGNYDHACDADCLELGVPSFFSNTGATVEPDEVDPGPGASCNANDGWCSFEPQPFLDNTVWFTFRAPESGCVDVAAGDADLQLAVWSVGDCADFSTYVEVGANDDSGPGLAPFLDNLPVNPGEIYWVQVDGYNGTIEPDGMVLVSDCAGPIAGCLAAPTIQCGETATGSTVMLNADPDLPFCGTGLGTASGTWYNIHGTGGVITLSTCNAGTNFDTKLGVFTGECNYNGLVCIAGNDDSGCNLSFLRSTVNFQSEAGTDYFIYVTGFGSAQGTFVLSAICTGTDPRTSATISFSEIDLQHIDLEITQDFEESFSYLVYPNPTRHSTSIDVFTPFESEGNITLFDQFGRRILWREHTFTAGSNLVAIDLHEIPGGMYLLLVSAGKFSKLQKLLILH